LLGPALWKTQRGDGPGRAREERTARADERRLRPTRAEVDREDVRVTRWHGCEYDTCVSYLRSRTTPKNRGPGRAARGGTSRPSSEPQSTKNARSSIPTS